MTKSKNPDNILTPEASLILGVPAETVLRWEKRGMLHARRIGGQFRAGQIWQVALNYVVPFCVATWGALINTRR